MSAWPITSGRWEWQERAWPVEAGHPSPPANENGISGFENSKVFGAWPPLCRRGDLRKFSVHAKIVAVCIRVVLLSPLLAQTPVFSIYPMRVEIEASAGFEKTAAFEIRAAPSPAPERGR